MVQKSLGNKVSQCLPARSVQFAGVTYQRLRVSWYSLGDSWMSYLMSEQGRQGLTKEGEWSNGTENPTVPSRTAQGLYPEDGEVQWGGETRRMLKWGWCENGIIQSKRQRDFSWWGVDDWVTMSHLESLLTFWSSSHELQVKFQGSPHLGIDRLNSPRLPQ